MKSFEHTISEQIEPTLRTIGSWVLSLHLLHQRLASHFARPEVHQHALLYLQAILSDIPRKNGWQIAQQARQARPDGMQRLLSRAVWDEEAVRDDLRSLVLHTLHPSSPRADDPDEAVLIIDESCFPKRGTHSAGVSPQYCGRTGRVENCQVGVFLSYATSLGHALIDRELYLPEDWCADLPRRRAVRIPESTSFRTKPELATHLLQRAFDAHVPFRWVAADTVYGHSSQFRRWLEEHQAPYVLAVPANEAICVQTRTGLLLGDASSITQQAFRLRDWHRLSASKGTKGERLFDWARLPCMQAGRLDERRWLLVRRRLDERRWLLVRRRLDERRWLLVRRCLDDPHSLSFFLVWAPPGTSLSAMVLAAGARWHIEEDLQACKALGLDQYEVRSFQGWYRHLTLVLLACAFLMSLCLHPTSPQPAPGPSSLPPRAPLTPSEVRHLLAHLLWPAPTAASFILHWSFFRRSHQYWAGYYHRRRRQKAP